MTAIANALSRNKYKEALQAYLDLERNILQILVSKHYTEADFKLEFPDSPVILSQVVTHILVGLAFQHNKRDQTRETYKHQTTLQDLNTVIKDGKLSIFNIKELYEKAIRICCAYTDEEIRAHYDTAYTFFDIFSSQIYATGAYSTELTWFITLLLLRKLFKNLQAGPIDKNTHIHNLESHVSVLTAELNRKNDELTRLQQQNNNAAAFQFMTQQPNNNAFYQQQQQDLWQQNPLYQNQQDDDDDEMISDLNSTEEEDYEPLPHDTLSSMTNLKNNINLLNFYRLAFNVNDTSFTDFVEEKNDV